MTKERHEFPEVDDLLRKALPGELPVDVEAGMRERIVRFRSGIMEGRASAATRAWLFRRSVWAVLSILMLVAGILLQGAGASSPLARRIASIKTNQGTVEPTRR